VLVARIAITAERKPNDPSVPPGGRNGPSGGRYPSRSVREARSTASCAPSPFRRMAGKPRRVRAETPGAFSRGPAREMKRRARRNRAAATEDG